jgi:hypothetical protein
MERRRRLRDGLAFAARELLSDMLDDLPARWNIFERFGNVLTELA